MLLPLCFALAGCGACGSHGAPQERDAGASAPQSDGTAERVVPLIDSLSSCDVDHRGLLVDLGEEASSARFGWRLEAPREVVASEHDGASWGRIYDRSIALSFYLPESTPLFVALRAIARESARVTVMLDGLALGTLSLARDAIGVASTRPTRLPVARGLHELTLRVRGREQESADPYLELDWIRIGVPDDLERTYGAPTLFDLMVPAAELGGVPHRSIGLRAPGALRCSLRVPNRSRLRVAVGMRGAGEAAGVVLVHQDGHDPALLGRFEVKGGEGARWTDLDLALDAYEGKVVLVELNVEKTIGTGRLLFGDPQLVAPKREPPSVPRARDVVLVVLDGVERGDLPPWHKTETPHLPALNALARSAAMFDQHRSSSTLVAAAVASLLSGVPPRAHALVDSGAKLPSSVTTIGAIARDASVRAAMFTGVPVTFQAFGFDAQWEHFRQFPPNEGRLGSAPLADASAFLVAVPERPEEARPELVVVHTRGGHPPWEVTPKDADALPPADYTGLFGPRRAAQILADVRNQRSKLSSTDRERMRALFLAGLAEQDQALGKLVQALEDAGRWDSTLFVVTGDVASGRQTFFADGLELDEEWLTLPLYVHFPGGRHAGERIDRPTELYDVTLTVLRALGLPPTADMSGRDLAAVAAGAEDDADLVRVAMLDDTYAARWGSFVLHGKSGVRPRLCDLSSDPLCAVERAPEYPIVLQALFRRLAEQESRRRQPPAREPVVIDSETAAMLKVWGAY